LPDPFATMKNNQGNFGPQGGMGGGQMGGMNNFNTMQNPNIGGFNNMGGAQGGFNNMGGFNGGGN